MKAEVVIILGSKSDLPVIEPAKQVLEEFEVNYQLRICSAHRAPQELGKMVSDYQNNGTKLFIAVAGAAAHLPGVIASQTNRPVIGVPVAATDLNGLDALYSMVQMPGGIPVASMAIGKAGAKNSAIFAIQILATNNEKLASKLAEQRTKMKQKVLADDKALNSN